MVQAANTMVMDKRLHLVRASFDELSKIATFNGDPGVSVALEKHAQALTDAAMGPFHFLEACEEALTKEAERRSLVKTALTNRLKTKLAAMRKEAAEKTATVNGLVDELVKISATTNNATLQVLVKDPELLKVAFIGALKNLGTGASKALTGLRGGVSGAAKQMRFGASQGTGALGKIKGFFTGGQKGSLRTAFGAGRDTRLMQKGLVSPSAVTKPTTVISSTKTAPGGGITTITREPARLAPNLKADFRQARDSMTKAEKALGSASGAKPAGLTPEQSKIYDAAARLKQKGTTQAGGVAKTKERAGKQLMRDKLKA